MACRVVRLEDPSDEERRRLEDEHRQRVEDMEAFDGLPRALREDMPWQLEQLVLRCLEKDPASRIDSVDALVKELEGKWGVSAAAPVAAAAAAAPAKAKAKAPPKPAAAKK